MVIKVSRLGPSNLIEASALMYLSLLPGISGTITSLACAPHHVGTTSLDRFFRLHGRACEASAKDRKGQTLEKVYTKSVATVVVWDSSYEDGQSSIPKDDEGEGDQVWEGMQNAEDDELLSPSSSHKKSRTRLRLSHSD
jgi:ribosome biogenesis protein NSA1